MSYRDGNNEIYAMNPDGSGVTRLTDNPAIDMDPAWSPDGSRIAFTSTRDGNYEIYVMNADGSGVTRLTNDPNRDLAPAWCGTRIAFQSDRYLAPFYDVYVMNDDGSGQTRLTISNASSDEAPSWSPSCDRIAYSYDPWGMAAELYVMNADGSGNGMLGSGIGKNRFPAWSPDGTRIAFSSDRDNPGNTGEIYVMNADGTQETRLTVRSDYHTFLLPAWSSDGARIAFQANSIASPGTYAVNADGSGLAQLADGVSGNRPAWFGPAGPPPPPNQLPVPSFTTSCSGFTCTFTSTSSDSDGTVVGYAWSFGDYTQASAAPNPSHTYARGGTYSVKLVVTDNQGATNTTWQTVTVTTDPNQPPVAAFQITCVDLTCSFTSMSSDADGSITAHSWTFGDGGTSTATNASHAYAALGTYTVTLTVTDNQGATDSTAQSLTLPQPNEPPVASFTTSCDGLTCHFNSTSHDANGSVTDLRWTFGDGGTSTIRFPSHTYAAGGSYTVTLTAYDNQGATDTASQTVTVTPPNQPPSASFTSDCADLTCNFTSTSSDADGSIVSYSWAFGDGDTAAITNPSHTYGAAGTYTVTLTVTDDQGATNTASQTGSVTAPPPPPPPPPPGGTWTTKAPMRTARVSFAAAEVNGMLYALGGWNGTTLAAVEAYDPALNTWTTRAPMPTPRSRLAAGVVDGVLYAVGGNGSVVQAYDPATDTWTTKAPMPTGRQMLGVGVVNGILYAVGGWNGTTLATVEAYDPATDTWTPKAPMPTARWGLTVGVVNGMLYAVGGYNGRESGTLEAYDPATDTWSTKAAMPTARGDLGVGVINGILYAFGGCCAGAYFATVEAYDPSSDTWTTAEPMPAPRTQLAGGVVNGILYAVGGRDISGTPVATVAAYQLSASAETHPSATGRSRSRSRP